MDLSPLFHLILLTILIVNAENQIYTGLELDYLFPSMIHEPAFTLTPKYKKGTYNYSFIMPNASKLYGPNIAFYLFAGQPKGRDAKIIINQDNHFFQELTAVDYYQSRKIPMSLTTNQTVIDLHVVNEEQIGPVYTIYVNRAK